MVANYASLIEDREEVKGKRASLNKRFKDAKEIDGINTRRKMKEKSRIEEQSVRGGDKLPVGIQDIVFSAG